MIRVVNTTLHRRMVLVLKVLTTCLILAVSMGCGERQTESDAPFAIAGKSPKSLADLIDRIRAGAKSGLFLRPEFISEQNLLAFFGGKDIAFLQDPSFQVLCAVQDFSLWMKYPDGLQYHRGDLTIQCRFNLRQWPTPNAFIYMSVDNRALGIPYDEVARIFGKMWKPVVDTSPPPIYPHPRQYQAPTNLHGNEVVVLDFSDSGYRKKIEFEFDHNGILWLMSVNLQRKV